MQYLSATLPTLGELQKGSTRLGTSLNKIFVAAALMALAELSGQQKVSVEWTFNGRDENWKTDLIGLTLSAIPVAVDMGDIHSPQDILREINEQNELGWPDMKLIVTIGTASFAPYIEKLRQALGSGIATDQLTYACLEATIGAPLRENESEYMLLPDGGFYEFIPVDDDAPKEPVLMDALEAGKEYEIILTNLSGFYRYRLGDVVRVTGYHNECPMLVFSYRKNQLISMYGEKMTETALRTAVEAVAEESGTTILEFSVYADASTDPGHYAVLMESDEDITPDRWPMPSTAI